MPEARNQNHADADRQTHRYKQNPKVHFAGIRLPGLCRVEHLLLGSGISLWLHWAVSSHLKRWNACPSTGFPLAISFSGQYDEKYSNIPWH
jgi:hypothetical protein